MENVFIMDHPLIQHKISMLRNKNTGTNEFRKRLQRSVISAFTEIRRHMNHMNITANFRIRSNRD